MGLEKKCYSMEIKLVNEGGGQDWKLFYVLNENYTIYNNIINNNIVNRFNTTKCKNS